MMHNEQSMNTEKMKTKKKGKAGVISNNNLVAKEERKLASLSLVVGPVRPLRYPATCSLDGDVLTDVLRAAATETGNPPLADLFRLSPMVRRLNRAVGRHPGVVALHEKARDKTINYSHIKNGKFDKFVVGPINF
jgi:hypothetical protein